MMDSFDQYLIQMRALCRRLRQQAAQCDNPDAAHTLDRVADDYEALVLQLDRSYSIG